MSKQQMQDMMVERRIACPEAGYPFSEARFSSIEEWEANTGLKF